MIVLCGQLVSISKTWNNCVHYGHDDDNDNSYNERYLCLIFCCIIYLYMDTLSGTSSQASILMKIFTGIPS